MAPLTSSPAPPTPLLTPPTKRRANETGLSDINTREKSARSVDRQIIAPKRRPVPPSSEGWNVYGVEASLGEEASVWFFNAGLDRELSRGGLSQWRLAHTATNPYLVFIKQACWMAACRENWLEEGKSDIVYTWMRP
jgi:hypothetical protein